MDSKVISADGHTDIVWLPDDLFVSEAPTRLKGHMPRVVETDEGRVWVADGARLGSVGAAALTGSYEPYVPGRSRRLDKMEERGFFSDAEQGRFHPSSPDLRRADQEADGVQSEVIYGVLGVASGFSDSDGGISDPETLSTVYDIYNDWIADFCKASPQSFVGLACISCHDPRLASRQLRRAADLGLRGVELSVSRAATPVYQEEWDILWAAAADCRMPISFHTVGCPFASPRVLLKRGMGWLPWVSCTPSSSSRAPSLSPASSSQGHATGIQISSSCWVSAGSVDSLPPPPDRPGIRGSPVRFEPEHEAQRAVAQAGIHHLPG